MNGASRADDARFRGEACRSRRGRLLSLRYLARAASIRLPHAAGVEARDPVSMALFFGEEIEMKPLQTGMALSLTVAVFYSLCTLIEVMWPAEFMGFMNALFHGMDFRPLQAAEMHPWRDFFYALAVMALWAFAMGAFFAAAHNKLAHMRMHRPVRHA